MTTLSNIETAAKGYLTFFKAHEKFLTIALIALLSFYAYSKGLTAWIDHDKRASTAAAQVVKTDDQSNQVIQQQLVQLEAQVAAQAVTINKQMQQRATDTAAQIKTDDVMSGQDLVKRFATLLNVNPGEVTWSPINGNVTFDATAAHDDINDLEQLTQLKADKTDLQNELGQEEALNSKQADLITGTQKELADEKISHADDVKTLKAESKKSFIRGFKYGFVAGAAAVYLFIIK